MARRLNRLTVREVKTLTKPGRHADGGNLYLQISPSGSKQWVFLYQMNGKQREMGLGRADTGDVSLAEARDHAIEARRLLAQGIDPIDARKSARATATAAAITFGAFADEYVETHRSGWSNPKHAAQWAMTLGDAYCKPIRSKPLADITVDDALAVLRPVWSTVPETARRVRMRLEKVLDAARVRGLRTGDNPARWKGHLDHVLPKHSKSSRGHHAALPWSEMPQFMARLAALPGTAAKAMRFLILTAARTTEVLNAQWSEFDLEKKVWTIPPDRMKSRREHRVPLSPEALVVLNALKGLDPAVVFPAPSGRGKPLSGMALLMLLRRLKREDVTAHGMRSTFKDWASEKTDFAGEVSEMALAHVVENATEAAYRRGDLFEKRRQLMADWAQYCTQNRVSNVVELEARS